MFRRQLEIQYKTPEQIEKMRAAGLVVAAAARRAATGKGRQSDISHAIEVANRRTRRYGIVDGYGGHGIGTEMHQDPHVLNHGRPGRGPRLIPGLVLAIEPMITLGAWREKMWDNGWTAVTADGRRTAQFEHTLLVTEDGADVLTLTS